MKKMATITAVLLIFAGTAHAQTISLSTYYPAPYGAYDRLRLIPIADPGCTDNVEGLLYYDINDKVLKVCESALAGFRAIQGAWKQDDTIDPPNAVIYLAEMDLGAPKAVDVGIGTNGPLFDLHITGGGEVMMEADSTGITFINSTLNEDDFQIFNWWTDRFTIYADPGSDTIYEVHAMTLMDNGFIGVGDGFDADAAIDPLAEVHVKGGGQVLLEDNADVGLTFQQTAVGVADYKFMLNGDGLLYFMADPESDSTFNYSLTFGPTGNLTVGGRPGDAGMVTVANQEKLNVDGKIMLKADGVNWGELMVEYDAGNQAYYGKYAPGP